MVQPNYFTCTLGEAALANSQQPCKTIPELVHAKAKREPAHPAVGFITSAPNPDEEWGHIIFTFADIESGSRRVATILHETHEAELALNRTVGLLCPSTPEFLFTWLALIQLGHAVLLIAPQCQPAAIANLCRTCEVSFLLHDEVYQEQAQESCQVSTETEGWALRVTSLPFPNDSQRTTFMAKEDSSGIVFPASKWSSIVENDVAYIHHTSGTSSGMPKPIPQSHRAAVGVLPSFEEGYTSATFTTTPLYHGGIADLFRAWTSGALIWLFPGKRLPITASNIVRCLEVAINAVNSAGCPDVKYFSSVPYVLQSMEADARGLKLLQGMEIVGVGGAALPRETGDRLVNSKVNLISRFGSAECGFLMSSHRDYHHDRSWQYLRNTSTSRYLTFEQQSDETSELIVTKEWPHMAKRNRADGSYATSDLFAPHETIQDAWRYHSRADSQLSLVTGKKFDPAPLEDAISTSDMLDDVLIFGNERQIPGALLIRSSQAAHISDQELIENLWPMIENVNNESQDHARISKDMIVPVDHLDSPLEKSSKGTIIRRAAETRFSDLIEAAYDKTERVEPTDIPNNRLLGFIKDTVVSTVPRKGHLEDSTDLFSYGVDSIASMRIRQKLRSLLPPSSSRLPVNVVEDCGSVKGLEEYILRRRRGQADNDETSAETVHKQMCDLAEAYGAFDGSNTTNNCANKINPQKDDVVVLTGTTGALGAHILDQYRRQSHVRRIYCLVRGDDAHAACERVDKALRYRKLEGLPPVGGDTQVVVIPAQLGKPTLGLESDMYDQIAREATIIMHVAWSVNFRMKLQSFIKDNIASVRNLIDLALKSPGPTPPHFGFCSSVASVMAFGGDLVLEQPVNDPTAATPLGYSQSKWVAEQICWAASKQSRLRGRVTIYRVGQLAGDSVHGVWNMKEAWPLMLGSVKDTGCLPALHAEPLSWLPVDVAASALIQGVESPFRNGDIDIYHIINEHQQPTWEDLLPWLSKSTRFDTVSPATWLVQLERLAEESPDHPALQLLDHWKRAYGNSTAGTMNKAGDNAGLASEPSHAAKFSMVQTKQHLPVLRNLGPVDEGYVQKLWAWIKENTG